MNPLPADSPPPAMWTPARPAVTESAGKFGSGAKMSPLRELLCPFRQIALLGQSDELFVVLDEYSSVCGS